MSEVSPAISTNLNPESGDPRFSAAIDLHESSLDPADVGRARADVFSAIHHERIEFPKHQEIARVGLLLAAHRAEKAAAVNEQPKRDDYDLAA